MELSKPKKLLRRAWLPPYLHISSNWRMTFSGFLNWSNCLCFWGPCCVTCPVATVTLLPLALKTWLFLRLWLLLALSLCFCPHLLQCLGFASGACLYYSTVPFRKIPFCNRLGQHSLQKLSFFFSFLLLSFCFLAHTCVFLTYFSSFFSLQGLSWLEIWSQ